MRQHGFSLLELIIWLTIVISGYCVLLPTLYRTIFDLYANLSLQQITLAINYGRSLAAKHNTTIKICPSHDHITCQNNWDNGLLVFAPNGTRTFFKLFMPPGAKLTLRQSGFSNKTLNILANGMTNHNGSFNYTSVYFTPTHKYTLYFNKAFRIYVIG